MAEENIELLIEFTRDDDPRTRAMAIAGLAKLADPRGFAPVLVALFDPVDEVRATAATALGIFGDDRAFEALVESLNDPNERVAANCVWSLGQIPSTRSLEKLFEIVADEQMRGSVRAAAATAIGQRAEIAGSDLATSEDLIEDARITMLNALEAEDDELRAASVWTLGHFPADKQTTYAVMEMLEDEYEWVVRYAIEALAHMGDMTALEPLLEFTDCDDEEIRVLAEQAIEILREGE